MIEATIKNGWLILDCVIVKLTEISDVNLQFLNETEIVINIHFKQCSEEQHSVRLVFPYYDDCKEDFDRFKNLIVDSYDFTAR
jgi:hypothetical protein